MPPTPLVRVRRLCLALPEAHEALAWGEPTFRVRNKLFAMYAAADNHHGSGRPALWCKAAAENRDLLIRSEPKRYFFPAYVGASGWVGIWLDRRPRWVAVSELIVDGYRLTAPRRLLAELGTR